MPEFNEVFKGLVERQGGNMSEIARKLMESPMAKTSNRKISGQLIGQYISGDKKPKGDFKRIWKSVFGDDIDAMIDSKRIETIVSPEANQYKIDELKARETFYRYLVEEDENYTLMPSILLRDYKMVPDKVIDNIIQSNNSAKSEIEKARDLSIQLLTAQHDQMVEGLKNKINRLEQEKQELQREKDDLLRKITT
jgi:hypothetical protein